MGIKGLAKLLSDEAPDVSADVDEEKRDEGIVVDGQCTRKRSSGYPLIPDSVSLVHLIYRTYNTVHS